MIWLPLVPLILLLTWLSGGLTGAFHQASRALGRSKDDDEVIAKLDGARWLATACLVLAIGVVAKLIRDASY